MAEKKKIMIGLPRFFIGGGMAYYGPTAERDKKVVKFLAHNMFNLFGNSIEIVTGGTAGIPEEFALEWNSIGGKHVLSVVSSEYEEEYLSRNLPFKHIIVGKSQEARRIAVTKLENIKCAIFIQGGKFSTHEMILFNQNKVQIVPFVGSGGAAGGTQPYNEMNYEPEERFKKGLIASADPNEDPQEIAKAIINEITK